MRYRAIQTKPTRAGASTFGSGEGSTAGVTSVDLSSGLGMAAAAAVGSDIMLWDIAVGRGKYGEKEKETYTYGY